MDTDDLKVVKFDRFPFSPVEPWYRCVDEAGRIWGAGITPEAARLVAERAVRRERERMREQVRFA